MAREDEDMIFTDSQVQIETCAEAELAVDE
jgi:hypothetical protein